MPLMETLISVVLIAAAVFVGLKLLKNAIQTAVLVVILAAILWYLGYIDLSFLGTAAP